MDDVRSFIDAAEAFFEQLAAVDWLALAVAICLHVLRLLCRVRGWQNILRASYPSARVRFADVFAAYAAGVGVNSVVPARGGDLLKLRIAKGRIEGASYPTVASTLVVETIVDAIVASGLFLAALQLGLLPDLPDLPRLPAFDWSLFARHPQLAAILGGVLFAGTLLLWTWASRRVEEMRAKVRQGFLALGDRRAFLQRVVSWQVASWLARAASVFWFLRAFHVDATTSTVLAVLVVGGLSTILPLTPGGAGTQQAVLVFVLAGTASASAILSFSVGMQLTVVVTNAALGFGAIASTFKTFRWRQHLPGGRSGAAADEPADGAA